MFMLGKKTMWVVAISAIVFLMRKMPMMRFWSMASNKTHDMGNMVSRMGSNTMRKVKRFSPIMFRRMNRKAMGAM
jgi:hypothetical protein